MITPSFDHLVEAVLKDDAVDARSDLVNPTDNERSHELYMWLMPAKISERAVLDFNEVTKFHNDKPIFTAIVLDGEMLIKVDHHQILQTKDVSVVCRRMAELGAAAIMS
jgi:hypothetical protein